MKRLYRLVMILCTLQNAYTQSRIQPHRLIGYYLLWKEIQQPQSIGKKVDHYAHMLQTLTKTRKTLHQNQRDLKKLQLEPKKNNVAIQKLKEQIIQDDNTIKFLEKELTK